ncbi:MAG: sensor histidine kinase [Mangrovicoccus sp.]
MTTVRLRLLFLALAPLILLMPLLLLLGMTRWTADYDEVLIANVESDLRIAEQYLARLMEDTSDELDEIVSSADFVQIIAQPAEVQQQVLAAKAIAAQLDFLYYLPHGQAVQAAKSWPVIARAAEGFSQTQIDIFDAATLEHLRPDLAEQARLDLIDTEAAWPTTRDVEDRGMVLHAASPAGFGGVLVGGVLLNRNLDFIDTINALVYLNAITGGDRQGTATLFLDDVRISTNVRLFEDVRALGTRVSQVVSTAVLTEGQTWLDRAFVVNDWYVSGYLPLIDSFGERVGMLYVGFLEAPFDAAKRDAYLWMMAAFAAVLALSGPAFFWLAKDIFKPLERMTQTIRRVRDGDLTARNGQVGRSDEIGEVAGHLDELLDQLQERDARLRAWADELNERVDQRTSELRAANQKLEETYRQLVLSEKLASIGEITAGVAHEINNPVAVIQGNVDVMRDMLGAQAVPVETELDLIDQQVTRIQAIVGKLLKFARSSEYSGYEGLVDLAPVIEDCLVLVDHVLASGEFRVRTDFAPVPGVRIDPGEMQQVVINLVVNAVHAMGRAGEIDLSLSTEIWESRAGVCLSVGDTGPGIPAEQIGAVFDPFFTTKQGVGTGLGLSISQTLIQRAGGRITARNRAGGGAEFRVWLPFEAEDAELTGKRARA